jgi:hypothetical protein
MEKGIRGASLKNSSILWINVLWALKIEIRTRYESSNDHI